MSMAGSNGVSISVSDEEECDELGRTRARVRRKRKKPSYRAKSELAQRVIRWLVKYWLFLVFVPATVLLLYEASRVGRKTSPEIDSKHSSERARVEKRPMMNLNRLEPKYRLVHGVRERCLKLLPQEDLEHLDIPVDEGSTGPVNKVLYISERDSLDLEGSTVLSSQFTETTRFNLFTGNQTLDQREKSFKVNETAMVHCGFYSDNGGFKISNEDKNYMERCEVVVSTCAFGGGDDLYQPIGMTGASVRKVCFVAFWDDITLSAQEYEKQTIGEDGFIGKWRIVVVKELPFTDQRLNGKIPKMLSHRLFPHAKYSIWVDSKSQFRRDPLGVQKRDNAKRLGLSSLQKMTAALRMLVYGVTTDFMDEYVRIGESTAIQCLKKFVAAILDIFSEEYLRSPNNKDIARLLAHGQSCGFPGMLGSIDCMHWKWKNCPAAWKGMYCDHVLEPTITFEAMASYDLWIWHAFFGLPSSNNDINEIERSHIFSKLAQGRAPAVNYSINGKDYKMGYYLVNDIYPKWSTFVKTIPAPLGQKEKLFVEAQETHRKDVERAFEVLQARFSIVRGPTRFFHLEMLQDIMKACIILHNMIIEDERDENEMVDFDYEQIDENPHTQVSREQTNEFMEFIQVHQSIGDQEVHSQLQLDLVEHLWQLQDKL